MLDKMLFLSTLVISLMIFQLTLNYVQNNEEKLAIH